MDERRKYYDHETVYRKIAAKGGSGWDDRRIVGSDDRSYVALDAFLSSRQCPSAVGARALEIGCGGGQATLRLARRGFEARGVDFSETAIALAQKNAELADVAASFEVGDALSPDAFNDESFELVVDNHLLHCIVGQEDRANVLGSVRRVLQRGGVFFCDTMVAHGELDYERLQLDPTTRVDHRHTRFWATPDEIRADLAAAQLSIEHETLRRDDDEIAAGAMLCVIARRR